MWFSRIKFRLYEKGFFHETNQDSYFEILYDKIKSDIQTVLNFNFTSFEMIEKSPVKNRHGRVESGRA